ncbi:SET and MYND domain-containing protein 4 isoform X2 [Thamnophis elegans]|uniref:SET and MYND domain-containing protein 4 isoform X2 n=1 Tax=Thamnophis elegans TaxID=35005 RepID=UPI0013772630|nr:SET and MYND domain-containing protein 4 isoform X2 [Thamnophis elegans]
MELLPAEPWRARAGRLWESLGPPRREELSRARSPRETLRLATPLLRTPEEEEEEEEEEEGGCLRRLARRLSVRKEPRLAEPCRQEGNRRFRAGEHRAAAALYSRALCHADAGSPEMAVCYANRSAALFHLGQFEVCLEDIGRAQQAGSCPEKLLPKIRLRRAECLLSLGRLQEAAGALHSLQESLSADQRPEAARHRALLGRLDQLRGGAGEGSGASLRPAAGPGQAPPDPEPWEESGRVSGTSVAVSLGFSSCKGRHLVAAEYLPPGKLLVREAAFASVLCPGQSLLLQGTVQALQDGRLANPDLHCHHCLRPLLASVPCRGCSYSRYCGPACAQLAWSGYHWAECALGGLLLALGVFCHVAFRTVLVAGFAQVKALVTQSQQGGAPAAAEKDARPIPGCEADGRYSGSYRAIFSLLPHTERHSPGLRFLCGLSVAALCEALEDAGLEAWIAVGATKEEPGAAEEGEEGSPPTALEVLGEAMLRHVLQLQCNGQAVTTLRPSGPEDGLVAGSGQVRLATGFFPALSLLNHSCDPNTSVSFAGCTAEVRALRPIPRGQELLHCYGPHRCRMGAAERRRWLLAQYFFECRCQACLEELQPSEAPEAALFLCPACQRPMQGRGTLRCSGETCDRLVPEEDFHRRLLRLQRLTQSAEELLEHGQPGQALQLLQKCRLDAESFLSPAHLRRGEIEDRLAQVHAAAGGRRRPGTCAGASGPWRPISAVPAWKLARKSSNWPRSSSMGEHAAPSPAFGEGLPLAGFWGCGFTLGCSGREDSWGRTHSLPTPPPSPTLPPSLPGSCLEGGG